MRLPLLLLLASTPAIRADWPEFRGPGRQGHSEVAELPVEWSPAVRRGIRWQVPVAGIGWSSPVVAGGRIYLTTAVPEGGAEKPGVARSLRALCLEATDGRLVWQREVFVQTADAPAVHKKNSHASPTPVFEAGRLYVHFGHQGSACLEAADGAIVWSTREFAYAPVHGNGGSPVLEGGLFIFNADAAEKPAVIALDQATGQLRWRFERVSEAKNKFSFSTPLVIEVNGARQLITAGSGVVNALDPVTGRELWKVRYGDGYSVVPRPVFAHGMIYVGTG